MLVLDANAFNCDYYSSYINHDDYKSLESAYHDGVALQLLHKAPHSLGTPRSPPGRKPASAKARKGSQRGCRPIYLWVEPFCIWLEKNVGCGGLRRGSIRGPGCQAILTRTSGSSTGASGVSALRQSPRRHVLNPRPDGSMGYEVAKEEARSAGGEVACR